MSRVWHLFWNRRIGLKSFDWSVHLGTGSDAWNLCWHRTLSACHLVLTYQSCHGLFAFQVRHSPMQTLCEAATEGLHYILILLQATQNGDAQSHEINLDISFNWALLCTSATRLHWFITGFTHSPWLVQAHKCTSAPPKQGWMTSKSD